MFSYFKDQGPHGGVQGIRPRSCSSRRLHKTTCETEWWLQRNLVQEQRILNFSHFSSPLSLSRILVANIKTRPVPELLLCVSSLSRCPDAPSNGASLPRRIFLSVQCPCENSVDGLNDWRKFLRLQHVLRLNGNPSVAHGIQLVNEHKEIKCVFIVNFPGTALLLNRISKEPLAKKLRRNYREISEGESW